MYTPNIQTIETAFNDSKPTTYDFLKPNGFRFSIEGLPHVSYTCQSITLPPLGFGAAIRNTPFLDFYVAGEKVTFGDLSIRFIVSEDMSNYKELYNWMVSIGDPVDYQKYRSFFEKRLQKFPNSSVDNPKTDNVKYSDATLTILTAANNPSINIFFKKIFPVQLSALQFDTTVTDIEYFTCNVDFKYEMYDIESI